jgi:hypothetical protein
VPESWGEVGLVPGRTAAARFAEEKLAEMEVELQQTLDEEAAWMGSKEFLLTLIQQPDPKATNPSAVGKKFTLLRAKTTAKALQKQLSPKQESPKKLSISLTRRSKTFNPTEDDGKMLRVQKTRLIDSGS